MVGYGGCVRPSNGKRKNIIHLSGFQVNSAPRTSSMQTIWFGSYLLAMSMMRKRLQRFVSSKFLVLGFRLFEALERWSINKAGNVAHLPLSDSTADVVRGTELWVKDIVVKHKLCPYAASSNYEIIVSTDQTEATHQDRKSLVFHHIDELEKCNRYLASKMIVFPQLPTVAATRLYFEVIDARRARVGNAYDYEPFGSAMKIQAVPFAPPILEPRPRVQIQGNAPWNTIQLLKYSDLQKVRGEDNNRGEKIRKRNLRYIEENWPKEKQRELLMKCQRKASIRFIDERDRPTAY